MDRRLVIDPDLERLIPRPAPEELELLENSILEEGCRDAIYVWNGTILDGHNRYRICMKHHIPFRTNEVLISCKDEAIIWICINQMGRRNLSTETRHYLIGKRYEAEKRIGAKNPSGTNQYSAEKEVAPQFGEQPPRSKRANYTCEQLGQEYHLGHHTIEQYGRYARNIDAIGQSAPELSNRLLSGELYVSMDNINTIAHLTTTQIQAVSDSIAPTRRGHIQHDEIMRCLGKVEAKQRRQAAQHEVTVFTGQSVKDTPAYNPDSAISSLALTMPTWIASMNRTLESANMELVTADARDALRQELFQLRAVIDRILMLMQ